MLIHKEWSTIIVLLFSVYIAVHCPALLNFTVTTDMLILNECELCTRYLECLKMKNIWIFC